MARLQEFDGKPLSKNLAAFLDLIATSEGTPVILGSDDGYNVLVGATRHNPLLFHSYADHPNVFNKAEDSTAAGRYQFIHKTWEGLAAKLGLKDFSPPNQDRGAIELVSERGALALVEAGQITDAIHKCCEEWASFPGGDSGQRENPLETLLATYRTFGGTESK